MNINLMSPATASIPQHWPFVEHPTFACLELFMQSPLGAVSGTFNAFGSTVPEEGMVLLRLSVLNF